MRIGQIINDKQPDVVKKLNKIRSKRPRKEKITHNDIISCMKHNSYRRGKGGAMKQVKWE